MVGDPEIFAPLAYSICCTALRTSLMSLSEAGEGSHIVARQRYAPRHERFVKTAEYVQLALEGREAEAVQ